MTKTRKAFSAIFSSHSHPLSAQDIIDCLKKEELVVNKTTVYRELEFFLQEGLIKELHFGDRKKRYERTSLAHHHHLICLTCQKVEDVEIAGDLCKEEKRIMKDTGFIISHHSLEFFGTCSDCQ